MADRLSSSSLAASYEFSTMIDCPGTFRCKISVSFKIRNDSEETWELLTIKLPPFSPYFPCIRGRHDEQVTKQWQLLRTWRKGACERPTVTTDTNTEKECDNKDPDFGGKHWRDGPKMKRRFRWAGIQKWTLSWCEALPTPTSSAFERL